MFAKTMMAEMYSCYLCDNYNLGVRTPRDLFEVHRPGAWRSADGVSQNVGLGLDPSSCAAEAGMHIPEEEPVNGILTLIPFSRRNTESILTANQ